jgi:predicted nucleic acid-binding protein
MIYADASVIVSAYLADEPEHARWHDLIFEDGEPVVVSEVARIEFGSAVVAAARTGRLPEATPLLARFDADCSGSGPIHLLALRSGGTIERAVGIARSHGLRALDAIHVAVAMEDAWPLADDTLRFATRDAEQSRVAAALGLDVA